jgi:putative DNA primase/helicase
MTPPIDVAGRLAEMTYHGPGESSVHNTQLSVTAAMLRRGYPVDEVVARVMEATAIAAGREGAGWDWRAEERTVRAMCRSWLEKHPQFVLEI